MCDTCPAHIPGPGEVAGGLIGLIGAAVASKPGRRVLFWTIAVPMLPFAVWGLFGWWTIALVAVLAAVSVAGLVFMRVLHRHALVVAPPSLQQRKALARARRIRELQPPRKALPAPAKAIGAPRTSPGTAAITGRVIAAGQNAPAGGRDVPSPS